MRKKIGGIDFYGNGLVVDGVNVTPSNKIAASTGGALAINSDVNDIVIFTGLSAAVTSVVDSGTTQADGQHLRLSFTDNGTARALAFGSGFEASTVALPTTTVINNRLDLLFIWNAATSKWRLLHSA
jgi:hypothetical protein